MEAAVKEFMAEPIEWECYCGEAFFRARFRGVMADVNNAAPSLWDVITDGVAFKGEADDPEQAQAICEALMRYEAIKLALSPPDL